MPRHTHPPRRVTHSRAHIRYQRDRYIERRWKQAKARHGTWDLVRGRFGLPVEPSDAVREYAEQTFQAPGPVLFVHPEQARAIPAELGYAPWPFGKPRGYFARNLFCLCSCLMCSNELERIGRRSREKRLWHSDALLTADDREGFDS